MAIAANETSRIELLERDIYIMLQEVQRIREHNEQLTQENITLSKQVGRYQKKIAELEHGEGSLEEIGYYILQQRQSMGLSLDAFAYIFETSRGTVSRFEMGKGSLVKARKLADKIREYRRGKK